MIKPLTWIKHEVGVKRLVLVSAGLVALTVWFRLWQVDQIPPGLHPSEAELGMRALTGKLIPALKQIQDLGSVLLTVIGQKVFSNPVLAVRVAPAAASAAAVWFYYHWLSNSFSRRIAQIGALFMATLPWVLYVGRYGGGYSLALLAMSGGLYLTGSYWQRRGSRRGFLTVLILVAGLYTHPSYNWFILGLILGSVVNLRSIAKLRANMPARLSIGGLVFLLVAAPAAPAVVNYIWELVTHLHGIVGKLVELPQLLILKAPESYDFNLATLPLLNAFVGLMFILGLLVNLSNLKRPVYRTVFALLAAGSAAYILLPASAPLADRLIALVIPALTLAAIGADYLLGQWLKTFPQNSAARQIGSLMLVVLLFFSIRHSYNQYFLAWRASSQTKRAYSASAIAANRYDNQTEFKGSRFIVGVKAELKVIDYLNHRHSNARLVEASELAKLPKDKQPKRFLLLPSSRDVAINLLAKRFIGGKLSPQLDDQKQELFLVYTLKK